MRTDRCLRKRKGKEHNGTDTNYRLSCISFSGANLVGFSEAFDEDDEYDCACRPAFRPAFRQDSLMYAGLRENLVSEAPAQLDRCYRTKRDTIKGGFQCKLSLVVKRSLVWLPMA